MSPLQSLEHLVFMLGPWRSSQEPWDWQIGVVLFAVMSIAAYLKAYIVFLSGIFNNFKVMMMLGGADSSHCPNCWWGIFEAHLPRLGAVCCNLYFSTLNTVGLYQSVLYSNLSWTMFKASSSSEILEILLCVFPEQTNCSPCVNLLRLCHPSSNPHLIAHVAGLIKIHAHRSHSGLFIQTNLQPRSLWCHS